MTFLEIVDTEALKEGEEKWQPTIPQLLLADFRLKKEQT